MVREWLYQRSCRLTFDGFILICMNTMLCHWCQGPFGPNQMRDWPWMHIWLCVVRGDEYFYADFPQQMRELAKIISALGWGLLSQLPPFHYFPNFECRQNTRYINITFIFDRCRRCSAAVTPVKSFACGEINERSFNNPHPWNVDDSGCCKGLGWTVDAC